MVPLSIPTLFLLDNIFKRCDATVWLPIYLLFILCPYQALVHGLSDALPLREDLREVPRAQHVPAQFLTF